MKSRKSQLRNINTPVCPFSEPEPPILKKACVFVGKIALISAFSCCNGF